MKAADKRKLQALADRRVKNAVALLDALEVAAKALANEDGRVAEELDNAITRLVEAEEGNALDELEEVGAGSDLMEDAATATKEWSREANKSLMRWYAELREVLS